MGYVLSGRETLHWEFKKDKRSHRGEEEGVLFAGVG